MRKKGARRRICRRCGEWYVKNAKTSITCFDCDRTPNKNRSLGDTNPYGYLRGETTKKERDEVLFKKEKGKDE